MRKTFITREYSSEATVGSMNMRENRNFFGSKILELEDRMVVDSNEIAWSENYDHTQAIGMDNFSLKLDPFQLKQNNHTLRINPNQSEFDKKEFTRWEFTFNVRAIIREYLFAQLKANKTFAGIENRNTLENSVNKSIYEYIDYNIMPRIRFETIDLYVRYYPLSLLQDNNTIALQYDATFRKDLLQLTSLSGENTQQFDVRLAAFTDKIQVKNFQLITDANQQDARIIYKQSESSLFFKFDYYFDVVYVKA